MLYFLRDLWTEQGKVSITQEKQQQAAWHAHQHPTFFNNDQYIANKRLHSLMCLEQENRVAKTKKCITKFCKISITFLSCTKQPENFSINRNLPEKFSGGAIQTTST